MNSHRRQSLVGPVLLVISGVVALLVQAGYFDLVELLHWYARWWPLLLIGAGLLAMVETWLERDKFFPRLGSNGVRLGLFIGCLGLLLSHHGSLGIYASGHRVTGEQIARFLAQK